jgi:hypothetical protein
VHLHYRSLSETLDALVNLSLLPLHLVSTAILRGLDNGRSRVVGPTHDIKTFCYPVGSEMALVGEEWKDG